MKILSKTEQLKRRADELFSAMQFQEHEIELKKRQHRRLTSWWIHNKGKARVMKYEIEEMQKVCDAITEFYHETFEAFKAARDAVGAGQKTEE